MSVIAALIRAGVAADLVALVADEIAAARAEGARAAGSRTLRQERNARYYQKQAEARRLKASETASYKRLKASEIKTPESEPRARVLCGEEVNIPPVSLTTDIPHRGTNAIGGPETKSAARGARLPADWQPSPSLIAFAASWGLTGDRLAQAVDEFRDYWRGIPGAKGRKLDWDGTFRNRIRNLPRPRAGPKNGDQPSALIRAAMNVAETLK